MQQKYKVVHTSHTNIRARVKESWEAAKEGTVVDLKKLYDAGGRFALTFDEWTGGTRNTWTCSFQGPTL